MSTNLVNTSIVSYLDHFIANAKFRSVSGGRVGLSSRDLRRSFATNFFGKIETPVLMQMTGHSRESTFLNYIGVGENKDIYANNFMEGLLALKTSKT